MIETCGDRYAILGFSGMKTSKCEYYRIKDFEKNYREKVKKRISGISPKDYTRMGWPSVLGPINARTRLFITMSNGRPKDYDLYKGDYAIEDD